MSIIGRKVNLLQSIVNKFIYIYVLTVFKRNENYSIRRVNRDTRIRCESISQIE